MKNDLVPLRRTVYLYPLYMTLEAPPTFFHGHVVLHGGIHLYITICEMRMIDRFSDKHIDECYFSEKVLPVFTDRAKVQGDVPGYFLEEAIVAPCCRVRWVEALTYHSVPPSHDDHS